MEANLPWGIFGNFTHGRIAKEEFMLQYLSVVLLMLYVLGFEIFDNLFIKGQLKSFFVDPCLGYFESWFWIRAVIAGGIYIPMSNVFLCLTQSIARQLTFPVTLWDYRATHYWPTVK